MTNFKKWPLLLRFSAVPLACVLIAGMYVLSILWRVSWAEEKYFGRSCLIPLKRHERQFIFPPTAASYSTYTYPYPRDGKAVFVYKQLINGFQHSYGSALVALEFGDRIADLLFRANEYCEGYLESDKNFNEALSRHCERFGEQ